MSLNNDEPIIGIEKYFAPIIIRFSRLNQLIQLAEYYQITVYFVLQLVLCLQLMVKIGHLLTDLS